MPGLTVAEKQHWRDRLAARIGRKIEAIKAQHPALFDRGKRAAHAQALESLGLSAGCAELEAIVAEEAALGRRKRATQRGMVAGLRGVPEEDVDEHFQVAYGTGLPLPAEAAEAIRKRQASHLSAILAEDPIGREVARLESEREGLLDAIWIATSPTQIRTLWTTLSALLGEEPTELEREALASEPSNASA